jgi:hypothetical protein
VSNSIKAICVQDAIPALKHIVDGREPQGLVDFTKANIELSGGAESSAMQQVPGD